jgi:hypothetical protein
MAKAQPTSRFLTFSRSACALLPIALLVIYYGTERWLAAKAFEFSSQEIADIANTARLAHSECCKVQLAEWLAEKRQATSNRHPMYDSGMFSAVKCAVKLQHVCVLITGAEVPGGLEAMFANITTTLAAAHPHAVIDVEPTWIFINAGGWMGSFALVYASLSEYVLLFGTAIPTSGHSGRYWAHIEDTLLTG